MNINQEEFGKIWTFFLLLIIVFILLVLPRKKCKSKVANEYGVSKYTLSRWIELFCTQKIAKKYVGDKIQKIALKDIEPHLGMPIQIPVYFKGGREEIQITSKEDLWKAHNIAERTLLRKIKAIENPMKVIGMSIETYLSLKCFPPSKMNLICNYLKSLGYTRKKETLYQIPRHSDKLVA